MKHSLSKAELRQRYIDFQRRHIGYAQCACTLATIGFIPNDPELLHRKIGDHVHVYGLGKVGTRIPNGFQLPYLDAQEFALIMGFYLAPEAS